ncbi:MAG: TspO/MBR family protein [Flavobacteriales bacterium]
MSIPPNVLNYLLHAILFALALGIGSCFTNQGVDSLWYYQLKVAPWQPPGWFFGVAWMSIFFLFSISSGMVLPAKKLLAINTVSLIYWSQLILNVLWNYLFFYRRLTGFALVEIVVLTILVWLLAYNYFKLSTTAGLLFLPYFIWLVVATSLNGYIWWNN